ncbi:MAG: hypothetical protein UMV23_07420 [Halanaerobium sp.]|nr:hypothetical protein [Halanaerobium sp.]
MYKEYLFSELKKWLRDPMMRFMVFYPIIIGLVGRYLLPVIAENSGFILEQYADLILVILTLFTPHIYGAVLAFSILDDRDDNILSSIKVTPLSIHQFISFRLVIVTVFSLLGCTFVMWFASIGNLTPVNIILISFLASLAAPATGLFINAFAHNKIEGFAIMKGSGVILVFPIIALFFHDYKEFFFSFAPGFWPAKTISSLIHGPGMLPLNYWLYYLLGLVYVVLLNIFAYLNFSKRVET